jgi:hypothetical protein
LSLGVVLKKQPLRFKVADGWNWSLVSPEYKPHDVIITGSSHHAR